MQLPKGTVIFRRVLFFPALLYDPRAREKLWAMHTVTCSLTVRPARTRKAAHTTMVTTFGLKRNMYQAGILFEVTLDELFE